MTRNDNETINDLVSLAQAGDRTAFSKLVRKTMNDIVALTYRMTGDREAAHDLTQDTYVSAWEKLSDFRGEAKFTTWLYRIASNKALNYKSSVAVSRTESLDTETGGTPRDRASVAPDRLVEQQQLREGVLAFMGTLPPQQRIVFELRFYRQMSFEEIAETTRRALGTVKTHYREAVGKLRQYAQERGWTV